MDYLPIFIQLRGEPAVVVGGGHVALAQSRAAAARPARASPWSRRSCMTICVRSPRAASSTTSRSNSSRIIWMASALVIAATDSREVNAAVSRAARARRVPVNVVDDPELSTFIFPAIIDRSPVIVAVGSSGHSPVLARRVRAADRGAAAGPARRTGALRRRSPQGSAEGAAARAAPAVLGAHHRRPRRLARAGGRRSGRERGVRRRAGGVECRQSADAAPPSARSI